MSSVKTRWSVMTCLAATAIAGFLGLTRVEHPPTSPTTVWVADDDDDWVQLQQEQDELQDELAQQAMEQAQQQQQIIDQENTFNDLPIPGN